MIDVFTIALVIIAVFSALFVGITEGFKLTIGYRGSEETRQRKERIDGKLREGAEKEIADFLQSDEFKNDGAKRIEGFQRLGYRCYVTQNLTENILDSSNYFMKSSIKHILGGTLLLFITAYIGVYSDFADFMNYVILVLYLIATAFFFWRAVRSLMKAVQLRESFVKLDENPTLEYATNLNENLP